MIQQRKLTIDEALRRIQHLCSTREKCTGEVREKLNSWGISAPGQEKILLRLQKDRFIDDRRYAGYFVKDKQKINKWGREKIRYALLKKGLNKEIIEEALSSLEAENTEDILRGLLEKKSSELKKYKAFERKNRLVRYAVQRGFDYDIIFRLVDQYIGD